VGVNPTRTGLFDLLAAMGATVAQTDLRPSATDVRPRGHATPDDDERPAAGGEPIADVAARGSALAAIEVAGAIVVRAIDEFPIFAVAATQAAGTTIVRDAAELRVKESDRIAAVCQELRKMGAAVEEQPDGMIIHGPTPLVGAEVDSHHDHRLAMALAVAGLVARGPTRIHDAGVIADSFPNFVETMRALGAEIQWTS